MECLNNSYVYSYAMEIDWLQLPPISLSGGVPGAELVIRNTSLREWDRIEAKSLWHAEAQGNGSESSNFKCKSVAITNSTPKSRNVPATLLYHARSINC